MHAYVYKHRQRDRETNSLEHLWMKSKNCGKSTCTQNKISGQVSAAAALVHRQT